MTDNYQLRTAWASWEDAKRATGYAHVADKFNFHMGSHKNIHFVNAYNADWDCMVCVATPARWLVSGPYGKLQSRPDMVFHTMFETSPVPPGWAENLNQVGLIWTPSEWSANVLRESGVTTPIHVIGYGVETDHFQVVDRSERIESRSPMKFLIWGDTLVSRKNILDCAKAFLRAELPDAELEIKLHSFAGMGPKAIFTDEHGNPRANISLHTGAWHISKLEAWLQSGDCGIYGSGGEALGLMPLQMMSTALPIICANNSGMMEYLKPDNHLPVQCDQRVKDRTYSMAYGYDCFMAKPDWDMMTDQIRWAYKHREETLEIGYRGAKEAQRWQWKEKVDQVVQLLITHFGRVS